MHLYYDVDGQQLHQLHLLLLTCWWQVRWVSVQCIAADMYAPGTLEVGVQRKQVPLIKQLLSNSIFTTCSTSLTLCSLLLHSHPPSNPQWLVWKYESDSTLSNALDGQLGEFPFCLVFRFD